MADYPYLAKVIANLTEGETDPIALMATLACEIHHADDRFHWTGFYRVVAPQMMKIGPYQGGHGCLVIPFSRGVCGAAARSGQALIVPNVNAFGDHIACSSSTQSELVIPFYNKSEELLGVLDIDSDFPGAFTVEDAEALDAILTSVFKRIP